jgi:hypothetical protein
MQRLLANPEVDFRASGQCSVCCGAEIGVLPAWRSALSPNYWSALLTIPSRTIEVILSYEGTGSSQAMK